MSGTVGVPDPIVSVERSSIVIMNLAIESAPVASALADADRTLESPVIGGIEDGFVILTPAFDPYLGQSLVPDRASALTRQRQHRNP